MLKTGRRLLARLPWVMSLRYRRPLAEALTRHGLLHTAWYVSRHPEAAGDPAGYFIRHGLAQGHDPHPLFSTTYYREKNPDVIASGLPPLVHYLFHGGRERRIPHPLVAPGWLQRVLGPGQPFDNPLLGLIANRRGIGPRPLFDMGRIADALGMPRDETAGRILGAWFALPVGARPDPHVLMDSAWMREQEGLPPDADAVEVYCRAFGTQRPPHPLFDNNFTWFHNPSVHDLSLGLTLLDAALIAPDPSSVRTSILFDNDHYLQQLPGRDTGGQLAVAHYLTTGSSAGRDPNPYVDDRLYRERYGHVMGALTPLDHYARHGREHWITLRPRFEDKVYLAQHPYIETGYDGPPLKHFLEQTTPLGRLHGGPAWTDTFESWEKVQADIRVGAARLGDADPEVSVIVPVYNQFTHTLRCLWSILQAGDAARLQVILADDGSSDETAAFFGSLPGVTYIRNPQNLGFLRSCNNAAQSARAPYLFFLNNDTAVLPGWIDQLLHLARATPDAGLVGSKLIYPDGTLQEAGGFVWADGGGANLGRHSDPDEPGYNLRRDADYISGAAILIPTSLWQQVGGFDTRYVPAYCEDTDLAMRLRNLGWRIIYQPASVVVHFEGVSSGTSTDQGVKAWQVVNFQKLRERWAFALETHAKSQPVHPRRIPRAPRPRILVIDHIVPEPDRDAGSLIMDWHVRLLTEMGYEVSFLPRNLLPNGDYGLRLRAAGVELLHAPYIRSIESYLDSHAREFDAFYLCRFAEGGAYIDQIRRLWPDAPVIFAPADLHFLRASREAELHGNPRELADKAAAIRNRELQVVAQASVTMVVSTHEQDVLREAGHTATAVVPLVMETAHVVPPRAGRSGIAFVGGYQHRPNVDAVLWFLRDIWPQIRARDPALTFHIVGSNPPPEFAAMNMPGVVLEGFVADLDAFLARRIATVVPLTFGAGIKGKIGSSLSQGVPVVSTAVGAEGMGLAEATEVLIADRPVGFADAVLRLVSDEGLWNRLSAAGLAFVEREYSPEVTTGRLLRLLEQAGATPFSGWCPITGATEKRRFHVDDQPDSLSPSPAGPRSSDRVAAIALARSAGHPGTALASLPAMSSSVDTLGLPALTAALVSRGWLDETAATIAARVALDDSADAILSALLARRAARRLILACPPVNQRIGHARAEASRLAAIVRRLEDAGWDVRTNRIPASECALTGCALIEARKAD